MRNLAQSRGKHSPVDRATNVQELRERDRATAAEWWSLVRASIVQDESRQTPLAVNIWHDVTNLHREEVSARSLARATEILSQSFEYEKALGALAAALVPEVADWCG